MDMQKIHIAVKAIWSDGTEGFQIASNIVGKDIALGMLMMYLWDSHNPRGEQWPQKEDTIDVVNKILQDTKIFNEQMIPVGTPTEFKLFVRWFKDHYDAGGKIELAQDGKIILSEPTYNNDRVYGFCKAIVRILQLMGYKAEMPMCLQGHVGPNRNRED